MGALGQARQNFSDEQLGRIVDILAARGELDESLRIRREEELPVSERLGNVRARAVTQGKIADVLGPRASTAEPWLCGARRCLSSSAFALDLIEVARRRIALLQALLDRGRGEVLAPAACLGRMPWSSCPAWPQARAREPRQNQVARARPGAERAQSGRGRGRGAAVVGQGRLR